MNIKKRRKEKLQFQQGNYTTYHATGVGGTTSNLINTNDNDIYTNEKLNDDFDLKFQTPKIFTSNKQRNQLMELQQQQTSDTSNS